jgi:NAD(P)-dependent dehydrogenase (short-subunit alcohol dehydrogenase family)
MVLAMQDKPVALITGANKGIGLQIAKDLAAQRFFVTAATVAAHGTTQPCRDLCTAACQRPTYEL